MVVKILKSAKGFAGIGYNEGRVKEGEAKLLSALNFGAAKELFTSINDYRNYLESWSGRNHRIKKPQFHVVLSCKGRSMSGEQLQSVAAQWLKDMGYGEVPALIYLHSNTKNTHIHIVTTRVGKDGNKLPDSFEKEKAVRVMNRIMDENVVTIMRHAVAGALRFSYSSPKQFMMILESQGYKVYENKKDNQIVVSYSGERITISRELLEYCQKRYEREWEREEQKRLSAILIKYSMQMNKAQLTDYLKSKMGIQLVFFGKDDQPYGYAIVDFRNKRVIKGSDVLPLKSLLNNLDSGRRNYDEMIRGALSENPYLTVYSLNKILKKYGVLYRGGEIVRKNADECVAKVDVQVVNRLRENSRAYYYASKYNPQTIGEMSYVTRRFGVDGNTVRHYVTDSNSANLQYYTELLEQIAESEQPKEAARDLGIRFQKEDNEYLMIDDANECVVSVSRLGISEYTMESIFMEESYEDTPAMEYESAIGGGVGLVGSIAGLIQINYSGAGGERTPRKKKRRD